MIYKVCPICTTVHSKRGNTCSDDCYRKLMSLRTKGNGGYRQGSGRAKTGHYKGIYCGSTYELVWVIYQLDHNIAFTRFPGSLTNEHVVYVPDFLINNNIIEIKGYEQSDSVNKKTALAESCGYQVTVLRKDDLKIHFDWVKEKYDYKELAELYDDYQPKYSYICSKCSINFDSINKRKDGNVFCSRVCSVNANRKTRVK